MYINSLVSNKYNTMYIIKCKCSEIQWSRWFLQLLCQFVLYKACYLAAAESRHYMEAAPWLQSERLFHFMPFQPFVPFCNDNSEKKNSSPFMWSVLERPGLSVSQNLSHLILTTHRMRLAVLSVKEAGEAECVKWFVERLRADRIQK